VECDKDGDNWLYWVNGEYGTLASDRTEVEEGDVVLWRYMDPAHVEDDSGHVEYPEAGSEEGKEGDK
jgi:hypothetical protein